MTFDKYLKATPEQRDAIDKENAELIARRNAAQNSPQHTAWWEEEEKKEGPPGFDGPSSMGLRCADGSTPMRGVVEYGKQTLEQMGYGGRKSRRGGRKSRRVGRKSRRGGRKSRRRG